MEAERKKAMPGDTNIMASTQERVTYKTGNKVNQHLMNNDA